MKKTRRYRPLLSLLMIVSLLIGSSAPAALAWETRETDIFSQFPQEINFAEFDYGTPEITKLEAISENLNAAAQKMDNQEAVSALLVELSREYSRFSTNYAAFYVAYCGNPNALSEEYLAWDSAANRLENRYIQTVQVVLTSPNSDAVSRLLGNDGVEYLSMQDVDTAEQLELLEQCAELVNQYWSKVSMDTPIEYQGKTYLNVNDVYAAYMKGSLDYRAYQKINMEMTKLVNAVVGPIFVDLVRLRNQYAESKGAESFADYAYQAYFGRDYTPADAAVLHEAVKKHLVPLSSALQPLYYGNERISSGMDHVDQLFSDATQEDILNMVEPYMGYISSEYADLFAYMRRCNLIDIAPSETKNDVGFTIDLADYGSAVIFNHPNGTYYDAQTVIHEFGHFAESCLSSGSNSGASFDVAEIDSQGLEFLYMPYIEDMIGVEGAANYRYQVFDQIVTYGVIMGCVRDEFLQRVYAENSLTLDKVNRIYHDVSLEYGMSEWDDTYTYDWYNVSHDFEQPFYYISYCTSALAALEILERSLTDYDAACDIYLNLVELGAGSLNGFRRALQMVGLSDVFEEETVAHIASAVQDYIYREVCGVSFTDLDDSWAKEDALFCAALGLFSGGTDGSFQPASLLTRAQAVSLLWRLEGGFKAENSAGFEDVSTHAWYAGAADWAYENGLVQGTSGTAIRFSPDTPVTRQEMAVLLYRLAGSPDVTTASLAGFSDADLLSPWTADGMAWCVENGLFHGRSGGRLSPDAQLTRGEAAAILANLFN